MINHWNKEYKTLNILQTECEMLFTDKVKNYRNDDINKGGVMADKT